MVSSRSWALPSSSFPTCSESTLEAWKPPPGRRTNRQKEAEYSSEEQDTKTGPPFPGGPTCAGGGAQVTAPVSSPRDKASAAKSGPSKPLPLCSGVDRLLINAVPPAERALMAQP